MNWGSAGNEILLNPRWPGADARLLREAAEKILAQQNLQGHLVLSSSGTTAESWRSVKLIFLPKQAVLSAARSVVKRFGFHSGDVFARSLPDFHVSGLSISARAFVSGGRLVDQKDLLEGTEATVLSLVPTQLHDLVVAGKKPSKGLRCVFIGGGLLPAELEKQARALGWPLVVTYGMTETSAMLAVREEDSVEFGFEVLPHLQAALSVEGLLRLKGSSLATGFAQLQENGGIHWQFLTDSEDWFQTEDQAQLSDGRLWVFGRGRDFVKIGGESVNVNRLREIFSEVLSAQGVSSIGFHLWARAAERLGHEIVLVSETADVENLTRDYNQRVLPFERIREILTVDRIPRTELHKVRETELKAMPSRISEGVSMEISKSPWEKGALFLCEKCGRRVGDDDYAENTKKDFKSRLKDDGFGKSIRVATSSCLSLCPKDLQVAAWCPADGPMEMVVYDRRRDSEDLYKWLKKR